MNDLRSRLKKCFAAVFPSVSQDQIETATPDTIKGWDSIAMVTLISVVEEEFGQSIPLEEIPNLNSFARLYTYLIDMDGMRP
jgi:acyl carrier protein